MNSSPGYLSDCHFRIECQYEIISLLELHLAASVNHHATLSFKALIPLENETVRLESKNIIFRNVRDHSIIFNGVISRCRKYKHGDVLCLEMTCKSRSWLLDFDPHSNTLQNEHATHNDVLMRVLRRAGAASIVQNDKPISPPIWQFEETDWGFAKRIAAIMDTVLIPDYCLDTPAVMVGFPQKPPHVVSPYEYDTEVQYFEEYSKFQPEKQLDNEFRCGDIYSLGDSVVIHGRHEYVMNVDIQLLQGVLECVYSLGSRVTPERKQRIHQDAEGVILVGTVLDTKAELLKVHFDVDESQPVDTAMWIPYEPDTCNVFYSMPEIGARVAARFVHECAVVITCLHEEDIDLYPSNIDRILNIPRGQQMAMLQRELFFNDPDSKLAITDADGVHCSTSGCIHLKAERDITIDAHQNIEMRSPEQVKINKYGTPNGIDMSINQVKIYSSDTHVVSHGEELMPYPVKRERDHVEVDSAFVAALIGSSISCLNPCGDR